MKIIELRKKNTTHIDETKYFKHLLETYETGILSVVSDTFDLWKVLDVYLPKFKTQILNRDGKLVIRPDSGNPADILCGYNTSNNSSDVSTNHSSYKGVVECLWDIFGGQINKQGYKVLDPHIGAIYGDSITIEKANEICKRLESKGFASTNVVLGIGSYTYQYNTRDSFGLAMKATYVEINGIGKNIFKDPVTDNGLKKSAKGLLRVTKSNGTYILHDEQTESQENDESNELKQVYINGKFTKRTTLSEIRERINTNFS